MTLKDGKPCKKCGTSAWNKQGTCLHCRRENKRKWNDANREKKRENDRRWASNNREKLREKERKRVWSQHRRESQRERARQYKLLNREKVNSYERNRYARKLGAGGKYTLDEWIALCEQYDNRCLACGRNDVKLTADHVIPISLGGSSDISNIQPLCNRCNSMKNARHIDYRDKPGLLRWIQRKLFD